MADRYMYNRYEPSLYIGSIKEFPMHTRNTDLRHFFGIVKNTVLGLMVQMMYDQYNWFYSIYGTRIILIFYRLAILVHS